MEGNECDADNFEQSQEERQLSKGKWLTRQVYKALPIDLIGLPAHVVHSLRKPLVFCHTYYLQYNHV